MKKYLSSFVWYIVAVFVAILLSLVLATLKYPIGAMLSIGLAFTVLLIPFLINKFEIGIFLIAFFLPFERVPTIDVGGATLKINHLLIVFTLIACLFALLSRKIKIPKDPVRWFVGFFLLTLIVSLPVAINMSRALQVYVFMLLMGVVYLIVSLGVRSEKILKLVVSGILWGALVAGFFGLLQFLGDMAGLPNEITLLKKGYDSSTFGFARIQAFSQEPLYFANYIFIPLLLLFFLNLRNSISAVFNRTLSYVLLITLLIDFILAVSRGAYLAAAVVLLAVVVTQAKSVINFKTVTITFAIIFFVGVGAYIALNQSESRALDEFIAHVAVEDRDDGESVVSRLSSADRAYEIFLDDPVIGIGLGNYGPSIAADPNQVPEEDGWAIVNNEYLEILAEGGIVAFLGFLLLIVAVFVRGIKAYLYSRASFSGAVMISLLIAFLAILVQYATFSTLYIIHVWFLIGLIGGISNYILNKNEDKNEKV